MNRESLFFFFLVIFEIKIHEAIWKNNGKPRLRKRMILVYDNEHLMMTYWKQFLPDFFTNILKSVQVNSKTPRFHKKAKR